MRVANIVHKIFIVMQMKISYSLAKNGFKVTIFDMDQAKK